jgi:hypothetical protein
METACVRRLWVGTQRRVGLDLLSGGEDACLRCVALVPLLRECLRRVQLSSRGRQRRGNDKRDEREKSERQSENLALITSAPRSHVDGRLVALSTY